MSLENAAYNAYMKADIRKIKASSENNRFNNLFMLGYDGKKLPKYIKKTDLIYGIYKAGKERGSR